MPMRQVTVGTGATLLAPRNPNRKTLSVSNFGTETCFLSNDASISTGTGFPIYTGQSIDLVQRDGDDPSFELYAISQTTTNDFRVFEGYGEDLTP